MRALGVMTRTVAFDGHTREAIARHRRTLADETDPAERGAGLREWGSGEATIASAALVGHEGAERLQFLSGEPFALRVAIAAGMAYRLPGSSWSYATMPARSSPGKQSISASSAGPRRTASGASVSKSAPCRSRTGASTCGWA